MNRPQHAVSASIPNMHDFREDPVFRRVFCFYAEWPMFGRAITGYCEEDRLKMAGRSLQKEVVT
ncbi:hypothetical protein [Nocardia araoensis]|uniref:hypothetical protein n=1 Tax=Nocardia araoensis TaxID=228600 RepID=UPI0012F6A5EB|nr:hypothetical protein [Nocardia araoensis]